MRRCGAHENEMLAGDLLRGAQELQPRHSNKRGMRGHLQWSSRACRAEASAAHHLRSSASPTATAAAAELSSAHAHDGLRGAGGAADAAAALGSAARLLQAPFVAPPLAKGETEGAEATSVV